MIFVGRGTYAEGDITNARTGMAAPQGLSFVADVSGTKTGDGAGAVTIDGTGTGATAGFNLSNAQGSLIDGFTITGFSDAGIVIKSGSDDLTIQNCIVFNNPGDGIRVQDSASVLVFNNLVYDNGGTGIAIVGQISGSPDARVLSNTMCRERRPRDPRWQHQRRLPARSGAQQHRAGQHGRRQHQGVYESAQRLGIRWRLQPGLSSHVSSRQHRREATTSTATPSSPATSTCSQRARRSIRGGPLNLPEFCDDTILRARTTTGTNLDTGVLDMGFHFLRNR